MNRSASVFFAIFLFSPIAWCQAAANIQAADAIDVLLKTKIIGRDSGQKVTKAFISECMKTNGPMRYLLECEDLLFVHHISFFESVDDKAFIVLVTEDGASVEGRWVFMAKDGEYLDVKDEAWPKITDAMVSQTLVRQTGNAKYTADYINSVAHSSYRVSYDSERSITVSSGIPDESYGVELGEITWDGRKFVFRP